MKDKVIEIQKKAKLALFGEHDEANIVTINYIIKLSDILLIQINAVDNDSIKDEVENFMSMAYTSGLIL